MKAARIYGKQDIRIEEVARPSVGDDQVQVQVKYVGICGSDIHMYGAGAFLPYKPNPLSGQTVPIIEGHEISGKVVKIGKNVKGLEVGDNVAIEPILYCGHCRNCRRGLYNYCLNAIDRNGSGNFIGESADGGMAEYCSVPAEAAYKLPAGMDYDLGALTEPVAVAYQGIKRSGLTEGQTVAVMGAGPIGLFTATLAKLAGATKVYITDVSDVRLAKAREMGIDHTINSAKEDAVTKIFQDLPHGVDISYDCAGVQATLDTAAAVTAMAGTIQVIAMFTKKVSVNMLMATGKGNNILTTLGYENNFETVINIINNNQDLFRKAITKKIPLDDVVAGIKTLMSDKSQVKILVSPEM
ncbi:2,3-butanediol dehydrogenase [Lactobacillus sp. ESL0791]|uniref:2,3-butanediol dehydrogenase n=1 Tax=Lactobacillus sp. ESL0791 TaxID=2983234 RepID=UPI0023FA17C2|nr:2,3-butanediol dehydrogenase [Lactobacillus sp. ESL0791]MDF7638080.1 2,3-butanediol dehydrogenase [Lactobacillus sp. ESL0791]